MTTKAHEFFVPGSPVSVNRYGTCTYRNWKEDVYNESVKAIYWSGFLISSGCSVFIRYYQHLDARKDVDNILKAILDGLDGKLVNGPKKTNRVLDDDRYVERIVSQRTKINFHTRFDGRKLRATEYKAALAAQKGQAAVFVFVALSPNHNRSVIR